MPHFEVKQTAKLNLTSYSGLALIGQCCQAAQVEAVIDPRLPVSQGMRSSDLVKSMVGLLSLGKSDFEAIEPFRGRRPLLQGSARARQGARQRVDAPTARCPSGRAARADRRALPAPARAHRGADPRLRRVCAADAKLLWRADSGFDSARLLFALADERDRWAALGRSFDYLTKWNPRRQNKAAWVNRVEAAGAFKEVRAGKGVDCWTCRSNAPGRRPSARCAWWCG